MNDLRRAKSAPRSRRGHQNADRSITALKNKIYYWTESRLEKLLPRLIIRRRQAWFAARLKALRSWPEFDKETLDYSWIQPRRGMDGKWYWPKSQLSIEREALESAPHDRIDLVALRETLAGLDSRQGDRLIDMLAERVDLAAGISLRARHAGSEGNRNAVSAPPQAPAQQATRRHSRRS
jgi:hypothetical protein